MRARRKKLTVRLSGACCAREDAAKTATSSSSTSSDMRRDAAAPTLVLAIAGDDRTWMGARDVDGWTMKKSNEARVVNNGAARWRVRTRDRVETRSGIA